MYENVFLCFYFLNVHISLTMYIIYCVRTWNIVMEGTVSQIFNTAPGSFFIKCRKNIPKKPRKVTRFFYLK